MFFLFPVDEGYGKNPPGEYLIIYVEVFLIKVYDLITRVKLEKKMAKKNGVVSSLLHKVLQHDRK